MGIIKDKVCENRLRRMAERQGYELHKMRRHDPRALDYGTYLLVSAERHCISKGCKH